MNLFRIFVQTLNPKPLKPSFCNRYAIQALWDQTRSVLLLLSGLFVVLSFAGCDDELDRQIDRTFEELDATLGRKRVYDREKWHSVNLELERLGRAGSEEERGWCYDNLAGKYSHFQCDTSAYYATLAMTSAQLSGSRKLLNSAKIRVAVVQIGNGELAAAERTFNTINLSDSGQVDLPRYYMHKATVFREMKRFCIFPHQAQQCDDSLRYCIRRYIEVSNFEGAEAYKNNFRGEMLRLDGRNEESIEVLLSNLENDLSMNLRGAALYTLSRNYHDLGDVRRSKLYAAQAAICHLQTPDRAYLSLYRLAVMLYETGDLKRANAYIQRTLNDATQCNYRLRVGQCCESLSSITQSFDESLRSRSRLMVFVVVSVSVLSLVVLVLLVLINRRRRVIERMKNRYAELNIKLSESNSQLNAAIVDLQRTNCELVDANLIKYEYVSQYMQLCVSYIQQLDTYRLELMKVVKSGGTDEVMAVLRSQKNMYETHKHFLEIFDQTFLGLFPDFVEQVNRLLNDSCRLIPKAGGQFTTELRYLALARLGISDSTRIALFLNSAVSTIYTYRARLRTARLDENLDLEEQVRQISISGQEPNSKVDE